jgi:hypothetical protein
VTDFFGAPIILSARSQAGCVFGDFFGQQIYYFTMELIHMRFPGCFYPMVQKKPPFAGGQ